MSLSWWRTASLQFLSFQHSYFISPNHSPFPLLLPALSILPCRTLPVVDTVFFKFPFQAHRFICLFSCPGGPPGGVRVFSSPLKLLSHWLRLLGALAPSIGCHSRLLVKKLWLSSCHQISLSPIQPRFAFHLKIDEFHRFYHFLMPAHNLPFFTDLSLKI